MAIFKCKICGGTLEIDNSATVATCEYCGTKQTLPKLNNDRRANMYDRANHFRRNNEFDKAMGIYENILIEDNTDAEAYWSLTLCRYGIEYVEDPVSHKRMPTVNRAQFTSIFDDNNYKSALQYADSNQRIIYEEEANAINTIQKNILAISEKEEPFDVFICYKETDNSGRRTPDSVLAQELYYELKNEGFNVFFSRITLEDKLGSAYEPYIFAALNSAKVMVVIGTKRENYNAAWVKNEWSRYLALIKNGAQKILIPAYRDMDPYDLPEEFSHLQAQDMSKLGFMQDLIRGIKKIVKISEPKQNLVKETVVKESLSANANINIAPLLKRALLFLEDGEFERADGFCEQILNQDPECAEAYVVKLMIELRVKKRDDLKNCSTPFDNNGNYKKAIRFGNQQLKTTLEGYIKFINSRNEEMRVSKIYSDACALMAENNLPLYLSAAKLFDSIKEYKDSEILSGQCKDKIYDNATSLMNNAETKDDYLNAIIEFGNISGHKDADEMIEKCRISSNELLYKQALEIKVNATSISQYEKAINLFNEITSFRDSQDMIELCHKEILNLKIAAEKDNIYDQALKMHNRHEKAAQLKAIQLFESISGWKDADKKITDCHLVIDDIDEKLKIYEAQKARTLVKIKRTIVIIAILAALSCIVFVLFYGLIIPCTKYNKAIDLMNNEKYEEAISVFNEIKINGFKNYEDRITECKSAILDQKYNDALELMKNGKYPEAISAFKELKEHKDSADKISECETAILDQKYNDALELMKKGKYSEAISAFKEIKEHKDSTDKISECETAILDQKYNDALELMKKGKYSEAISAFKELKGHKDSNSKITECDTAIKEEKYANALALMEREKYDAAATIFRDLGNYKDSKTKHSLCSAMNESLYKYNYAVALMNSGNYDDAIILLKQIRDYKNSDYLINLCTSCENLIFSLNSSYNAYLVQSTWYAAENVIIPEKYNDLPVIAIYDNAFIGHTNLTTIFIPDSIIAIKKGAFWGCKRLAEITIPNSVYLIEKNAFKDCSSLESIVIPDSVTTIGDNIFAGCSNLKEITIPFIGSTVADYNVLSYLFGNVPKSLKTVIVTGGTLHTSAFKNCSEIESIILPSKIVNIADYSFSGCSSLKNISIPNLVTRIGNNAFSDCSSLETIVIPKSVTIIGNNAFSDCSSLKTIVIPESVTIIGNNAFSNCSSLETIVIPESVTIIGARAFKNCSNLKSLTILNKNVSIEESVFYGCSDLTIVFNGTVEEFRKVININPTWDENFFGYTVECIDGYIKG